MCLLTRSAGSPLPLGRHAQAAHDLFGFVFLVPGTFFTLSMLPMFRGIQSALFGVGSIVTFATMGVVVLGLFFSIYLYGK